MSNFFLHVNKEINKIAKYFVFSTIFMCSLFLVGKTNEVKADKVGDYFFDDYQSGSQNTNITGELKKECTNLQYSIISNTYSGNGNSTNCVSYNAQDKTPVYYLQAQRSTDNYATWNTITFKVQNPDAQKNPFKFVIVAEENFSLSQKEKTDYDEYTLQYNSNKDYDYANVVGTNGTSKDHRVGTMVYNTETKEYEFTYQLRNSEFRAHTLHVYFYTIKPEVNNESVKIDILYTLAKPISDYKFSVDIHDPNQDSKACDLNSNGNSQLCIEYINKKNTGEITPGMKKNNFYVKFSQDAAFYYSTVNTHNITPITSPDIHNYNSIYATNTFYNQDDVQKTSKVVYEYFNFLDETTYKGDSITATTNYSFNLEIDAMGTYDFFLVDIFGNTLDAATHVDDDDSPTIEDISNRTLTTYYIIYDQDGGIANWGDNKTTGVLDYQLEINSLAKLTNKNITIGLEFYSTINIDSSHAIPGADSQGEILKNPLSYAGESNAGSGTKETEIRIQDSVKKYTYFCRLEPSGECIEEDTSDKTNYVLQALIGTQTIQENITTGLKGVSNTFNPVDGNYSLGQLGSRDDTSTSSISKAIKHNRTQLVLNENGEYKVHVQDIYGNEESSTIKVSVIDQEKPMVKVNHDQTTLDNYICSNMYVIGAGADNGISQYPTAAQTIENCGVNTVVYNNFEAADIAPGASESLLTRPTDNELVTLGFYNTHSDKVTFNYADAIRIGLVRAYDNIVKLGEETIEKSIYQKNTEDYTSFKLYSKGRSATAQDLVDITEISGGKGRVNYGYETGKNEDLIIKNDYNQYSSELKAYDEATREYVLFKVYEVDIAGTREALVCDSQLDKANNKCNNMVNTFIDKGINFELEFYVQDYVGNSSNPAVVKVNVIDNTTPGIVDTDPTGLVEADPKIFKDNVHSRCRLEMGSKIQTKTQLLECYGFLKDSEYKFADNSTGYLRFINPNNGGSESYDVAYSDSDYLSNTMSNAQEEKIYNKTLSNQLYKAGTYGQSTYADKDSFYNNIKIYVCKTPEKGQKESTCANDSIVGWDEITDTNIVTTFPDAGNYKIKFEITDVGHNYKGNTHDLTDPENPVKNKNKTIIVLCYYVNPRVLLVRPKENSKKYGDPNPALGYCVYATTNTDSFFYNLFHITNGDPYKDTYDFVYKNYESAKYGLVYCTDELNYDAKRKDNAVNSSLADVLASKNASITGGVNYTYASGSTTKYNMELDPSQTYNAYQDAGYYYMTMGDLAIDAAHKDNYVLRLHPGYLLDGMTPNENLENYDSFTDDAYKYTNNVASHGETISNVIYRIDQTELKISALGGNKNYANPDTNYPQANNSLASVNVHQFLNVPGVSEVNSTAGYLNGFDVDGLIETETVKDYSFMNGGVNQYDKIINGYLRRAVGEEVGVYNICNNQLHDTISEACDILQPNKLVANEIELSIGTNVYVYSGSVFTLASDDVVRYGMYVDVNGKKVKLTRDNTKSTPSQGENSTETITTFVNTALTDTWKYDYDDSNYSLKINPNDNNANQNYYITYTHNEYIINPGKIVVQPGSNQGKEYANPQYNDPLFEIVIFGEENHVTQAGYGESFNGFTAVIEDIANPNAPTYNQTPFNNQPVPDTEIYFDERRTRTTDKFADATFVYKFAPIALKQGDLFDWQGQTYHYSQEKICLASSIVGGKYTQCEAGKIGVFKVEKKDSNIIISTIGNLTYQNYSLFSDASDKAGSGKITRNDPTNINVGWYNYVFTTNNLHAVYNSLETNVCSVSDYVFSIDKNNKGNQKCANYNVDFDDAAPKKVITGTPGQPDYKEVFETTYHNGGNYLHNGSIYCAETGAGKYSYSCKTTSDDVKVIKFFIFKRDVILSFNAFKFVYFNLYGFFKDGIFTIKSNQSTVPTYIKEGEENPSPILTCYKKDINGIYTGDNGEKYTKLTTDQCEGSDYGISKDDYWGPDAQRGLNLKFFLAEYIQTGFSKSHALPAGLYKVFAKIGNQEGVHPNYNLVYIDYDRLVEATTPEQKDGAIEIIPREVSLVGTFYQKEFGQAMYNSYDVNGTQLTTSNVGKGQYSALLGNIKSTNKIFDNHYYYCEPTIVEYNGKSVKKGCKIVSDDIQVDHSTYKNNSEYGYNNINNIFLYTIKDYESRGGIVDGDSNGKITDQIAANFIGTPIRERVNENDPYGLLDNVDFYPIDLSGIEPAVVDYDGVNFDPASTIYRYTNYVIKETTKGGVYITPASIEVNVFENQKKMYGCAYNTFSIAGDVKYVYGVGYEQCIETNGKYFDLGYKYSVKNDKLNWLKAKIKEGVVYPEFNQCASIDSRNPGTSCVDVVYNNVAGDYNYDITPNYNSADAKNHGKPDNTALNEGTLYRISGDYSSGEFANNITYDYKTYFEYATKAQLDDSDSNRVYQNQDVGKYFITLGNLDSKFNQINKCNKASTPIFNGGLDQNRECKNFIVNYNGNNTAGHTKSGNSHMFVEGDNLTDEGKFELNDPKMIFEIFGRKVVLNTEYNYKVYGDTEPNEGFTCDDLKKMYPNINFKDRGFCQEGETFIKTGVTRYYAVDNSLAKAPWTSWTLETNKNDAPSHNKYNDVLFDVIDKSSSITRTGIGDKTTNANRNDPGGKYHYIYDITLNTQVASKAGKNYFVNYISFNNDINNSVNRVIAPNENNLVFGANVGFAKFDKDGVMRRWYGDTNHACHSVVGSGSCNSYNGTEVYNFHINNIQQGGENNISYITGQEVASIKEEVYFEIVYREIYIRTKEIKKDYGIEENYNDFDLDLVRKIGDGNTPNDFAPIQKSESWGDPYSLSLQDYQRFFPDGKFSLTAFTGTNDPSKYRGGNNNGAFGIYYYRTRGETVNQYVIVACATQKDGDTRCDDEYKNMASDALRKEHIAKFIPEASTNEFNASNYIIHTIPSTITIENRQIYITPDSNQGFMYGNYETGKMIPPITFKEHYKPTLEEQVGTTGGLVNGGILSDQDNVKHQIALCIYDITGRITCINDRQNSDGLLSSGELKYYITTTLHNKQTGGTVLETRPIPVSEDVIEINNNVYNDDYTQDNDATRNALNRVIADGSNPNMQRYNRNVGKYKIVAGELINNVNYCSNEITANCLDTNYKIIGVKENVEYDITPATIVVTPIERQNKTYGEVDSEIKFKVETKFEFQTLPLDDYYCVAGGDNCQYIAPSHENLFNNENKAARETGEKTIIHLTTFAYDENRAIDSINDGDLNYGSARVGNKLGGNSSFEETYSTSQDDIANDELRPKFFDKYCYLSSSHDGNCTIYTAEHPYASMKYDATSRILLGYFYVDKWEQRAKEHKILNGIMVADNEFGNVNYLYKTDAGVLVSIGMDTTKTFTINKLAIDATMPVLSGELNPNSNTKMSISKTYGQATDSHKADLLTHNCGQDGATIGCILDHANLTSKDNENRLEYNFNVTNDNSVNVNSSGIVILTKQFEGHYYTQTANAEYKNIHLGLSVVREKQASDRACAIDDVFGCEDVDVYKLVFRKASVTNDVDINYNITYGNEIKTTIKDTTNKFISVQTINKSIEEAEAYNGGPRATAEYAVYTNDVSTIDTVVENAQIDIVNGYEMELHITPRNVRFYVGTYERDGRVAERYIIEQNEQVPEFPELHVDFTTSETNVPSKEIYKTTWFDKDEYSQAKHNIPRQVRTQDKLKTTLQEDSNRPDIYGVGICTTKASNSVQDIKYGTGDCGDFVQYYKANQINADEKYYFDTSEVGEYAILRNHDTTYITYGDQEGLTYAYEANNYVVEDFNGTLVIYEDQTAPIISVGNNAFPIEANADKVLNQEVCSQNIAGKAFYYDCSVAGKLFDENAKDASIGQLIEYISNNYSGFKSTKNLANDKGNRKLPTKLPSPTEMENWIYQPVNNIGVKATGTAGSNRFDTTLYTFDRTDNTYAFEPGEAKISTRLNAVSSIVSWFNVNSYDYSFIRNDHYITKRYTPRYYFYIGEEAGPGKGVGTVFDPTYVGDIKVTIYAIDNVGNQSAVEVKLQVVDTTKPEVSKMYLFNSQVTCNSSPCKTNTIDNWFVQEGYVPIKAFKKYSSNDSTSAVLDEVNGQYIRLNGDALVNYLDPNKVTRYTRVGEEYKKSVTGEYVLVNANKTHALEVEHMSWYNNPVLYMAVVGGKDNSYIDPEQVDANSQWDTYYTFDEGSNWYKYDRHALVGTKIKFTDGISKVYTQVIDSGRKFTKTVDGTFNYYNNIYLSHSNTCAGLEDCNIIKNGNEQDQTVTQITNMTMTQKPDNNDQYTFKINGTILTYNKATSKVTWMGQPTPENVVDGTFKFGNLMSCTIGSNDTVSCSSDFYMIYKTNDKKSVEKPVYTIQSSKNIGDFDAGEGISRLFYDRRYVLIDTKAPVINNLNGYRYSLYEYTNTCQKDTVGGPNESCGASYGEKFLKASDSKNLTPTVDSNSSDNIAPSTPGLTTISSSTPILLYIGDGVYANYDPSALNHVSVKNGYSGLLMNDTNIIGGINEYDNSKQAEDTKTLLSKYNTEIVIFLSARKAGVRSYYKYTAIYTNGKYVVLRQKSSNSPTSGMEATYSLMENYSLDIANDANLTTIEDVIEFIVSTASLPTDLVGAYLDFSINYNLLDAAGNTSVSVANLTVRGVTYVKYESTITPVNQLRSFNMTGKNTYSIDVNQGVSLTSIIENLAVNNIDYNGNNNVNNLRQTIYYNGEIISDNQVYNPDVISDLESIASAPGEYTIKITSTRELMQSQGVKVIEDEPLTVSFNILPSVSNTSSVNNYTYALIGVISMILGLFAIIYIGILFNKKRSK